MATQNTHAEPRGYADAMREVETILADLDSSSVDVDTLTLKVERASFLINWCNERIAAAEIAVDTLVADLEVEDSEEDDPLQ